MVKTLTGRRQKQQHGHMAVPHTLDVNKFTRVSLCAACWNETRYVVSLANTSLVCRYETPDRLETLTGRTGRVREPGPVMDGLVAGEV